MSRVDRRWVPTTIGPTPSKLVGQWTYISPFPKTPYFKRKNGEYTTVIPNSTLGPSNATSIIISQSDCFLGAAV